MSSRGRVHGVLHTEEAEGHRRANVLHETRQALHFMKKDRTFADDLLEADVFLELLD